MSVGKVIAAVIGAMLALVAIGLLAAGGGLLWAYGTQRTSEGFFVTPTTDLSTDTYALTSTEIDLSARPADWFPSSSLATVRLEAESAGAAPVFVGIGPEDQVDAYLSGVGRAEVTRIGLDPDNVTYRTIEGDAPAGPPSAEDFWVASAEGSGSQVITWDLESGEWTVVIMNADSSPVVTVDVSAGARIGILAPIAVGMLIGGVILGAAAAALLVFAVRKPGGERPVGVSEGVHGTGPYPVTLTGTLDPAVSRWQWLVKWLLALPHFVVLAFLWAAFSLLTIVAWFAILFTGRYPRGIFDFNVGVLRWSWRVTFYSYGVLGTDRYPPFKLDRDDYPAALEVEYPERLSRGLVFVKWLLAIPHLLIVGLFTSGLVWWAVEVGEGGDEALKSGGGLIAILVFIAGVILLFTGRYPQGLFDLIMGLHRWVFRVGAYVALMRDEYPPFRLDAGGSEPTLAPQATGTNTPT